PERGTVEAVDTGQKARPKVRLYDYRGIGRIGSICPEPGLEAAQRHLHLATSDKKAPKLAALPALAHVGRREPKQLGQKADIVARLDHLSVPLPPVAHAGCGLTGFPGSGRATVASPGERSTTTQLGAGSAVALGVIREAQLQPDLANLCGR